MSPQELVQRIAQKNPWTSLREPQLAPKAALSITANSATNKFWICNNRPDRRRQHISRCFPEQTPQRHKAAVHFFRRLLTRRLCDSDVQ
jgi:hypothetical protein